MNQNRNLQINDKTYNILVSQEDYDRALSDSQFANSLLIHARIAAENSNNPSTSGINKTIHGSKEVNSNLDDSFSQNIPPTSQKLTNVWSYEQTIFLINSMATYYNDFNDSRKRKHNFEHIANDLISAGFAVDTNNVQNKWKGLMRSYTKSKDIKNRTGQGPSRFLFFELIDDTVGTQPKNNCTHALNSLKTSTEVDIETENSSLENNNRGEIESQESEVEPPRRNENRDEVPPRRNENRDEEPPSTSKKRKRLSEKQLKSEYMDLKRGEYEKRQRRHEEKCSLEKEMKLTGEN